ncbi:hypothetical protein ATO6_23615 [Oceanicola sp. 22II-s10i]|uniref:ParB/RepB/Spo0J family partition protein n=1 Tax=Oceanicola sp. 22II-s10i TaxID=1317116 RepID=UPI000B52783A|nr:ParB N-terminal domain-containing protein [Oceanicola sp. 22II-s10i]OWU81675.1 hypothetical protein ATO6_23615 [Oceanicola sp. 22II-s10i]
MAKRRRLAPPSPFHSDATAGTGANADAPDPVAPPPRRSAGSFAPIASVAGETSAAAALSELAETIEEARRGGRMVVDLPLDAVEADYLVRDRIVVDEEEMRVLMESLAARGQQTPIDVTDLGGGRYGLISGWRRLEALRRLAAEGRAPGGGHVLALLRRPEDATEAYVAMIEENEIRVGLSYYERARIAARAVDQGVFGSERDALRGLFHSASRAKRSKIGSFLTIVRSLDGALRHPAALGERAGLVLARALDTDPGLGPRLRAALEAAPPASAEAELKRLTAAATSRRMPAEAAPAPAPAAAPQVTLERLDDNSLRLSGPGVTDALEAALARWLAGRG